jgi:hypothetical protein
MSFIEGGKKITPYISFHHETGSLLQINFEVDMYEWTTSWRFN